MCGYRGPPQGRAAPRCHGSCTQKQRSPGPPLCVQLSNARASESEAVEQMRVQLESALAAQEDSRTRLQVGRGGADGAGLRVCTAAGTAARSCRWAGGRGCAAAAGRVMRMTVGASMCLYWLRVASGLGGSTPSPLGEGSDEHVHMYSSTPCPHPHPHPSTPLSIQHTWLPSHASASRAPNRSSGSGRLRAMRPQRGWRSTRRRLQRS